MAEVNNDLKNNLYLAIYNALKESTNLSKIRKELNISKQNLNNYIRELKANGLIIRKGRGHYEIVNNSKEPTKYDSTLPQDFIRGHAYIWNLKLPKNIKDWDKRKEIIEKKGINIKMVGALKDIPRIKVLGRKVWLCKDHIRIFDIKDASYYGMNAIESKKKGFAILLEIVNALESKLGFIFKPFEFEFQKEHYALIKNDLAIDQNKKGIIWRISDETGEWLLIDDSLEQGGELENVGKDAFKTNLPMQKWWNDNKNTNFQVTPTFLMESLNKLIQEREYHSTNIVSHIGALQGINSSNLELKRAISKLTKVIGGVLIENRNLKLANKHQKVLSDF